MVCVNVWCYSWYLERGSFHSEPKVLTHLHFDIYILLWVPILFHLPPWTEGNNTKLTKIPQHSKTHAKKPTPGLITNISFKSSTLHDFSSPSLFSLLPMWVANSSDKVIKHKKGSPQNSERETTLCLQREQARWCVCWKESWEERGSDALVLPWVKDGGGEGRGGDLEQIFSLYDLGWNESPETL